MLCLLLKSARELNSSHSRSRPKNSETLLPFDLCMFRFPIIMLSLSFTMGNTCRWGEICGAGLDYRLVEDCLFWECVHPEEQFLKKPRMSEHSQNKAETACKLCHQISDPAISPGRKALPLFFICIFSSITCLKKPVFSKRDLLLQPVEGTSQAVLGSSDQRKSIAKLSRFLKSEKIPALPYFAKAPEYRPFIYLQAHESKEFMNQKSSM